jgi:hypothetical protein
LAGRYKQRSIAYILGSIVELVLRKWQKVGTCLSRLMITLGEEQLNTLQLN